MLPSTFIIEQKIAQKWKKWYVLQNDPYFKLKIITLIPKNLISKGIFHFINFEKKQFMAEC
jgi:hypothetical protein